MWPQPSSPPGWARNTGAPLAPLAARPASGAGHLLRAKAASRVLRGHGPRGRGGKPHVPQRRDQRPQQPGSPACCSPCSRRHQGSTCASTGPPLPGSLRGRGGPTGRGQELPAPAWARRHTGRNVPFPLPGPPSACRPAHPGAAECRAQARWRVPGAQAAGDPPTSVPTRPRFPSVYKRVQGRGRRVQAWHTARTQRPGGLACGAHPQLAAPAPCPA